MLRDYVYTELPSGKWQTIRQTLHIYLTIYSQTKFEKAQELPEVYGARGILKGNNTGFILSVLEGFQRIYIK